jgi:hypothetical protein
MIHEEKRGSLGGRHADQVLNQMMKMKTMWMELDPQMNLTANDLFGQTLFNNHSGSS